MLFPFSLEFDHGSFLFVFPGQPSTLSSLFLLLVLLNLSEKRRCEVEGMRRHVRIVRGAMVCRLRNVFNNRHCGLTPKDRHETQIFA